MKAMQVGELKANFSKVIEEVKKGKEIVITYGKKKQNVAVIVPYAEYKGGNSIKLGILQGKASAVFKKDFKMTTEELIGS